jgi:hypothetical protein
MYASYAWLLIILQAMLIVVEMQGKWNGSSTHSDEKGRCTHHSATSTRTNVACSWPFHFFQFQAIVWTAFDVVGMVG